jgi:hypothetical protein
MLLRSFDRNYPKEFEKLVEQLMIYILNRPPKYARRNAYWNHYEI